ncbi:MAG: hypothetical protein M1436_02445, partial [Acidobacteria bacterium]|nr:hypothetical protein [Acidobacteriota bacterium]
MMRSITLIVLLVSLFTATGLLAATNTWQGISTSWGTPGNWSTGAVPTNNDHQDIVIPAGAAAYPALTADVVVDGSVTIAAGAALHLNGHTLSLGSFPVNNTKGVFNSGTLDAGVDGAVLVLGRGGFVNSGVVTGLPTLNFKNYCFDAPITAGGAEFAGIQLDGMNDAYKVTLTDNTTIHGDVNITGGHLSIGTGARMIIEGNLHLNVTGVSGGMGLSGDIQLYGNLTGSGNASSSGGSTGWVTLVSAQDQQISDAGATLPPIRVAKAGGKAVVNGDLVCAGLQVDAGNTLDLTACRLITFTGSYARGLLNAGTLLGQPKLFFSSGSYNAVLKSGGATIGGIDIETGNVAYGPTLQDNANIVGDITLRRGYINLGNHTLSLNGSLSMAKVPTVNTDSVQFRMGAQGLLAFVGTGIATLDPGDTQRSYWYGTAITNMSVNKPGGKLVITGAPAEVTGSFALTAGTVSFTGGGELWLFTYRDRNYRLLDIGLRLLSDITPEQFPPLTSLMIGPAIPDETRLNNIAPTAVLSSQPYVSMIGRVVDNDPEYRTAITPEDGLPANIFRLFLKFSKPQNIASISWVVPNGPWALLADCDGDGTCETLLRADLKGVFNVSSWADRQVITNHFWPPVRAYKVMFVNPK